jgi:hypothetical protein
MHNKINLKAGLFIMNIEKYGSIVYKGACGRFEKFAS